MWYLLFDGSSTDGRGSPKYVGRTRDKERARIHFNKVSGNPYSTGKVMIADDFEYREATEADFQ